MRCPKCGSDALAVTDSRSDSNSIRRRRECQKCQFRFTTYERIVLTMPMVIKKDARRETFDSEKIRGGIVRACEKRAVSVETIDSLVEKIEQRLVQLNVKEVPSTEIGSFVMHALKEVDQIAYVRFASVYREFSDVSQFVDTLQSLVSKSRARTTRGAKSPAKKKRAHSSRN